MKATEKLQGWQPCTFGDVLKERVEGGSQDDELLSVTNSRGIISQSESNKRDTSNTNKSKYKRVYVDDIVYNTMRMWQGVSGRSSYNGIVSPAYTVCTPVVGNDSKCLAALLKHPLNVSLFRRYSQGLVDDTLSLKYDVFARLPLLLPAKEEQPRIAKVLDELEAAIRLSEELITKLKQIRAGLLQDLLTRGIGNYEECRNPEINPEQFKDSQLGRIPKDWDVKSMTYLTTKIVDGVHARPNYVASGVPFLTVENITSGAGISMKNVRFIKQEDHMAFYKRADPRPNDVLVTKDGTLGVARVVPSGLPEFSIFVSLALLRPNSKIALPQFISTFFQTESFRKQLGTLSTGTGLKHIHLEHFRKFNLATPPKDEQKKIIDILDKQDLRINAEGERLHKLQQIKQALSNDLLTGNVKIITDAHIEV